MAVAFSRPAAVPWDEPLLTMHPVMRNPKTPAPAPASTAEMSYEDALGELERLVASMEEGQLPLDRLMQSYERGAELLQLCRSRLDAVEQQVKVLEDGRLKPWAGA
jgi:exodeoxyribonuclease VII small subunit